METESEVHNPEEEEEEEADNMEALGCPYKKFKFDSDEHLDASFVTTIGDPNDINSNGGENGSQPVAQNASEIEIVDETVEIDNEADVGSENEGTGSDNGLESDDNYEEIEQLLDQALPDDLKNKKRDYEERFKTVMEEKGRNPFEVLPEGWVQVTHDSGMPLYLHRHSRVCSLSRPYFLGPGSVRKHEIPVSSIPCLNYQKALEKEKELMEQQKILKEQQEIEEARMVVEEANGAADLSNGLSAALNLNKANAPIASKAHLPLIPNAKVESVSENLKANSLTPNQFTEYCKKRFNFKTIRVLRFKSWSARRKFTKNRKHIKHLQRPTLPEGTKLITFPVLSAEVQDPNSSNPSTTQRPKKEWVMNPNGKSFVCILHEYVQHAWKKQPSYEFKELENSATPYLATVSINSLKYGTGYGTSKKQAKSEAARETLEILIPEMREKISGVDKTPGAAVSTTASNNAQSQDLSVFDEIRIEDPRVSEYCSRVSEPLPHSILLTCLQRNFGLGSIQVKYEVNTVKHKKNEFTMTVGSHEAKVFCKNKRDGKQRASQAILQILHPHIKTWGSLLRLYGNRSVKSFKEKKQEEQEITILQNQAAVNQPNYAILEKLKVEMVKLKDIKKHLESIGGITEVPSLLASNITIANL